MNVKTTKRAQSFLKVLALVLILTLAMPLSAFATVSELTHDTTTAGKSLANTYPAQKVDLQISLAEDATHQITIPVSGITADALKAAVDSNAITFTLSRDKSRGYMDPAVYPNPYTGGAITAWKDQKGNDLFKISKLEADGTNLKFTLDVSCFFYSKDTKDYSAPHVNGGAYIDYCGYFDLTAMNGQTALGSLQTKVVPYDAYRTLYELHDEINAIADYDTNLYVEKRSMGHSTVEGYDMPYLVIAKNKKAVQNWLEYTDLAERDPDQALANIKANKYGNLKVPVVATNVHTNENSAVNGILNLAWMLVDKNNIYDFNTINGYNAAGKEKLAAEMKERGTALSTSIKDYATQIGYIRGDKELSENYTISAPIEMNDYYDITKGKLDVDALLEDVFFIIVPTMNPEGYEHQTRTSSQGYDPNRDEANQTLFEDANLMHIVNQWNPMVLTEIHGRVEGMLIEPCTPPHEPNFEYDLIAKQFVELGEALGSGAIANNDTYNSFEMPMRDYLAVDPSSPSGVAWTEPWDDMTTAYGSQYPVLIGTCGITWEQPAYNDISAEQVIPYGMLNQGLYAQAHKKALLTSQAKLFKRGIENYNSNKEVSKYYVDQYDQAGKQADLMRPTHDGKGENGNFYAEAFIIPLDKANQKNLQDAAEALKYLARNDIKLNIAKEAFTYDGVTYPKGTMVVSMYQAKRSLAHSQLFSGSFISVWSGLYSESYAQQPYARGYDIIEVAEPASYKKIMAACTKEINTYEAALTYLKDFASQFSGVKNADVIIENVSEDSSAAVNALLKAGKTVGVITKGKDKGDFICDYQDYLTVAKKYILNARGVYGASFTASIIEEKPDVYLVGKPANNTTGYVESTMRAGSYNYMFDRYALEHMGFGLTTNVAEADVIIGSTALSDTSVISAIQTGTPYMGYGSGVVGNKRDGSSAMPAFLTELGVKYNACDYGTDMLAKVEYPTNSLVNASYINEGDDVLYEYGTGYFSAIPEGASVLVKNAGKKPLQGCIGLFNDDLNKQFDEYNTGVQGFAYEKGDLDIVLFANALTYKAHQSDEYTFISNFIFSNMLGDTAYVGDTKTTAGVKNTTIKLSSAVTKKGSIKLSWTKSKGYKLDYYEVFRSVKKNSGYGKAAYYKTKTASKTTFTNTSVKKGTRYYYKVRGVRVIDGKKIYTQYSNKTWKTAK